MENCNQQDLMLLLMSCLGYKIKLSFFCRMKLVQNTWLRFLYYYKRLHCSVNTFSFAKEAR